MSETFPTFSDWHAKGLLFAQARLKSIPEVNVTAGQYLAVAEEVVDTYLGGNAICRAASDLYDALLAIVQAERAAVHDWDKLSVHPWQPTDPAMVRLAAAEAALSKARPDLNVTTQDPPEVALHP